jgi:hypothetical protein
MVGVSGLYLPSITRSVDSRERNAAVVDLEERLVLEVQAASQARWDGLRETNDGVVVDDGAAEEVKGVGEGGDDARSCEELEREFGQHLECIN